MDWFRFWPKSGHNNGSYKIWFGTNLKCFSSLFWYKTISRCCLPSISVSTLLQKQLSIWPCQLICTNSTSTITPLIVFFLFRFTLVMFPSRICRVLLMPYDLGEAALLDSLISTAYYENKRYRGPMSTYWLIIINWSIFKTMKKLRLVLIQTRV